MARQNGPRSIGGEANLAERIAYERDKIRGWSYETLARKMTAAGCSIQGSAIFKIEKGTPRRRVTVDELIALSTVFGVSIEELLKPMELLRQERAQVLLEQLDEGNLDIVRGVQKMIEAYRQMFELDASGDEDLADFVRNLRSHRLGLPTAEGSPYLDVDIPESFDDALADLDQRMAQQGYELAEGVREQARVRLLSMPLPEGFRSGRVEPTRSKKKGS